MYDTKIFYLHEFLALATTPKLLGKTLTAKIMPLNILEFHAKRSFQATSKSENKCVCKSTYCSGERSWM